MDVAVRRARSVRCHHRREQFFGRAHHLGAFVAALSGSRPSPHRRKPSTVHESGVNPVLETRLMNALATKADKSELTGIRAEFAAIRWTIGLRVFGIF